MRVLVLDDNPARHKKIASMLGGKHDLTHVSKATEAFKVLMSNPTFDCIMFDYDLGDFQAPEYVDDVQLTGADVARKAISLGKIPPNVVIHSLNPSGAAEIRSLMEKHGCRIVVRSLPQ